MADLRNPGSTSDTAEPRTDLRTADDNPPKVRTAMPSNVPQTAGPSSPGGDYLDREETARRAYELYQRRGGTHGRHEDDWYEAERQLREERRRSYGGASQAPAAKTTAKKTATKKSAAKKASAKKSAAKKSAAKKSTRASGGTEDTGGKG